MKRILMCPPTYYTVRDVKNPFMQSVQPVDADRAAFQWQLLRENFERAGVETVTIDPVEDLEDMVFAANQVFVGSGTRHARFILPSRMRHASREREVPYYVAWFTRRGYRIIDPELSAGEFLEGHGDLIVHPGSARVWAGFGFRSTRAGIERFAHAVEPEGITVAPLELTDPTFYHLDTCFAPLNDAAAIVYPEAFAADSLALLRRSWPYLYEAPRADALRFACNGLAVNGRYVVSHASPWLEGVLAREGLRPALVDTSEFEKAGGSVFCMKASLE